MMQSLLKVKGHERLCKDAQSGGVINTDKDGLRAAREAKQRLLENRSKIEKLEQRINELESLFTRLLGEKV